MQDSSIKNVLMLIGELTGLNIVVTPEVTDTITANLENVSVKAALDVILIPNGYNYVTQENVIIVKAQDFKIERDLVTRVIKLKYIDTNALTQPLKNVFTDQGRIDPFTLLLLLVEPHHLICLILPLYQTLKKISLELCHY